MKILSSASFDYIKKEYKKRFGLTAQLLNAEGICVSCTGNNSIYQLPVITKAHQNALKQAIQWGEANTFYLTPGIISWIVPIVDNNHILGGISGGEIISDEDSDDRTLAINYLASMGYTRDYARRFVKKLPNSEQIQISTTVHYLYELVYAVSGYNPVLLNRNREDAKQQQDIAANIQEMKSNIKQSKYSLDEERMLLSLMKVGDITGAKRVLNKMLAAIFLYSPRTTIVRARAIEMIGYLTRSAIEDNPQLEHLLERHLVWIEQLIHTENFEHLCITMRDILDEFISDIILHGYNRSNRLVSRILEYISDNFTSGIALDDLVKEVNVSRAHICHLVKQHTGKTISQHIRAMRLQEATRLLKSTSLPYSDIAYRLGFTDQSYFIKQFKEAMGITPAQYRHKT